MPRSIFLGRPWPQPGEPLFTREDTGWALALRQLEQEEAAEKCHLCGLPKAVCRDIDNQFRFVAAAEQCHAAAAIASAQESSNYDSPQAIAWSAQLIDEGAAK